MLKEFWEQNKYIIQIFSILIAIGAIFLTIGPSGSEKADTALARVQIAWLVIITLGVTVIVVQFHKLAYNVEKNLEKLFKLDISNAIAMTVLGLGGWIIYNLWAYMISLYSSEMITLFTLPFFSFALTMFIAGLATLGIEKLKISSTHRAILFMLIFPAIFSTWFEFMDHTRLILNFDGNYDVSINDWIMKWSLLGATFGCFYMYQLWKKDRKNFLK